MLFCHLWFKPLLQLWVRFMCHSTSYKLEEKPLLPFAQFGHQLLIQAFKGWTVWSSWTHQLASLPSSRPVHGCLKWQLETDAPTSTQPLQPGQPNFYIGQVGNPICEWILLESAIPPCSLCVSQTFGSLLLLLYWTNMVILDFNISLCLIHLIHTAWLPKGRKERRGLAQVLIDFDSLCVSQTFGSLLLLLYWTNVVILDFNISWFV